MRCHGTEFAVAHGSTLKWPITICAKYCGATDIVMCNNVTQMPNMAVLLCFSTSVNSHIGALYSVCTDVGSSTA